MATISGSIRQAQSNKYPVYSWEGLGADDDGSPCGESKFADKTVQFSGTFSGATAVLQGSMDETNWYTLTYDGINPISFTSEGMSYVFENPHFIRPATSGGDGSTDIDCYLGMSGLA